MKTIEFDLTSTERPRWADEILFNVEPRCDVWIDGEYIGALVKDGAGNTRFVPLGGD